MLKAARGLLSLTNQSQRLAFVPLDVGFGNRWRIVLRRNRIWRSLISRMGRALRPAVVRILAPPATVAEVAFGEIASAFVELMADALAVLGHSQDAVWQLKPFPLALAVALLLVVDLLLAVFQRQLRSSSPELGRIGLVEKSLGLLLGGLRAALLHRRVCDDGDRDG